MKVNLQMIVTGEPRETKLCGVIKMMVELLGKKRYSSDEACKVMGITFKTLKRWGTTGMRGGVLQLTYIGRRLFVYEQHIEEFLQATSGVHAGSDDEPKPAPIGPKQRRKNHEAAEKKAESLGC